MALPAHLRFLLDARAYPHPVRKVILVETHISWILLTGELAYKVKRPVRLPFVDLTSRERRQLLCNEEVRLNCRFAADIYIGVCNITADEQGARIGGVGPVIDYAVKMRQFNRSEELDSLLISHRIQPAELEAFGIELAQVHAGLPVADEASPWARAPAVRATVLRNLEECIEAAGPLIGAQRLRALRAVLEQQLEAASSWMRQRRACGKVRECHGDLHCSNVVRRESHLTPFDCLEFEPAFRWIDVADEVAFLLADLQALQRPAHMQAFLSGYLTASGDYHACRFLDLYAAHRSLVRAKVTALSVAKSDAATERAAAEACEVHLGCAQARLRRKRPILILMAGLSGSGKTWRANHLAVPFGAVHIRSDVERKRLAGLSATDRSQSAPGRGLYAPEVNARLHAHLLAAAESTLSGGFTTIVDATFSSRDDRRHFGELGKRLGVVVGLVHCRAPLDVLRSRVEARERAGADPSEAGLAVLDWQLGRYDPLRPDEPFTVFEASSSEPGALVRLKSQLAGLQALT
jgi:aminoglycoside phosphotransferase family enzyme/predicted kinase